MKNTLYVFLAFLVLTSCSNNGLVELEQRIAELENENLELRKNLKTKNKKKVLESNLLGSSFKQKHRVNEESKLEFLFVYPEKFPEYDVYLVDADGIKTDLIQKNLSENKFQYSFTPIEFGVNYIRLIAVFKIGDVDWEVPAQMGIEVFE